MFLANFDHNTGIFVDANVFTYFALENPTFQSACTDFLARIEGGQIQAVTSVFVLNEAFYAILIGKGSELLDTTKIRRIKTRLSNDSDFATSCYQAPINFSEYVAVLLATGLQMLDVDYNLQASALSVGQKYRLLPTDALHVATCQRYGISHIATADAHFEQVDVLTVWKPKRDT